jgi:hypothetical protein
VSELAPVIPAAQVTQLPLGMARPDRRQVESAGLLRQLFGYLRESNVQGLRSVLEKHVDINTTDDSGVLPLMVAIEAGNLEAIKLISAAGADLNAGTTESPLSAAIRLKKADITAWLLQCEVDITVLNTQNESALYSAIRAGDLNLVRILTERGIDLNCVNTNSMSPLYIAVGLRQMAIVKFLLNNGAKPNEGGLPCLKLAQDLRDTAMVNTLLAAGAKIQARKAHRSRQQMSVLARTAPPPPPMRIDNGVCVVCRGKVGLLKLIPCGHVVVCRKCVDMLVEETNQCPICQMGFYATSPIRK